MRIALDMLLEVLLLKCLLDGEAYDTSRTERPCSVTCLAASILNSSEYRLLLMNTSKIVVMYDLEMTTEHGAIQYILSLFSEQPNNKVSERNEWKPNKQQESLPFEKPRIIR